jgi:hypothetical protein
VQDSADTEGGANKKPVAAKSKAPKTSQKSAETTAKQ